MATYPIAKCSRTIACSVLSKSFRFMSPKWAHHFQDVSFNLVGKRKDCRLYARWLSEYELVKKLSRPWRPSLDEKSKVYSTGYSKLHAARGDSHGFFLR